MSPPIIQHEKTTTHNTTSEQKEEGKGTGEKKGGKKKEETRENKVSHVILYVLYSVKRKLDTRSKRATSRQ